MKLKKNKKTIIAVIIIAVLILVVGCTCNDDSYSDDHTVNIERCLQSLEDGSAYEIDEALTAKAPWKAGEIVVKIRDGEGGYYLREFIGVTKAGYYLVQDYRAGGFKTSYPRYNPKTITNQKKITEPYALMNCSAVIDKTSQSTLSTLAIPSACGTITNYYAPELNETFVQVCKQGIYLDGAKHGEWVAYNNNGSLKNIETYRYGIKHGPFMRYYYSSGELESFTYYHNGQLMYSIKFNEMNQIIQIDHWYNGEKIGIWHKRDIHIQLIEEINYESPS